MSSQDNLPSVPWSTQVVLKCMVLFCVALEDFGHIHAVPSPAISLSFHFYKQSTHSPADQRIYHGISPLCFLQDKNPLG